MNLLPLQIDTIPAALTARPQWVLWRGVQREGKLTKVPYTCQAAIKASTTDSTTWTAFTACVAVLPQSGCDGLGYVFADDPYTGIDLDKCVSAGVVEPWAQTIIDQLDSYTEISVSGTGIHIIVEAALPAGGRKRGAIEMYDQGRYFTMSGQHLPGTPSTIEPHQAALDALYAATFPTQEPRSQQHAPALSLGDLDIVEKARHAKNSAKFAQLWGGDTNGYGSHSEADLALCSILTFYCDGPDQVDRLFRQSGLLRGKWDTRHGQGTYGEQTVSKAWTEQGEHYRMEDYHQHRNGTATVAEDAPKDSQEPRLPLSNTSNAQALLQDHGANLHYVYDWKTWLVWTNTHWDRDTSGAVIRAAKQTVKTMLRQVERLDEKAAIDALMRHVKSSLATTQLKAMVENAQSEPGVAVTPHALDTHPSLLNCANGTLDLRTGALLPHDRTHLLTKCLAVSYDPDATCPTWMGFLERIQQGSAPMIAFLQRVIGYSLTGATSEQCLFLLHGSGANGKSTFLEVLQALLGDYAQSTPSASLLAKDRHDGIPNDIARLRGARVVTAVEIGEGRRLNEELVKRLTGQDKMTARFLRAEFFDFLPEFKLFIACNHLPQIRGTDHAIWRRIRRIPFLVTIPDGEQDPKLPEKLKAELPGILAWAVRGCLDWHRGGLRTPEEVTTATADYKSSMDVIGAFLDDCCVQGASFQVKARVLYETYKAWCEEHNEYAETDRSFGSKLTDRGFQPQKSNSINWRLGVGLPSKETQEGKPPSVP